MTERKKRHIIEGANYKYNDYPLVTRLQWKDILLNRKITREIDIKMIFLVFNSPENRATASHLAEILGEKDYRTISGRNKSFSIRVCEFLNIKPPPNESGGNRWWTIPYLGDNAGHGKFFYILRPELKGAIEDLLAEGKITDTSQKNLIPENTIIEFEDFRREFDHAIEQSGNLTKEVRMHRIINADKKPVKMRVVQTIYKRNPDIIIEALERANGRCEACKEPAPFLRKKDSRPYLEVHHITPLADGGQDTLDNTIAVCPNCHRRFHFGL